MTTLLSWMSVDSRGPSAIYIVTDSRITWGSSAHRWDSGRKVFAASTPDIFGYCGDVLFPSLVLGQIVDLVGRGLLWDTDCSAAERHRLVAEYLQTSFGRRHNAPDYGFTIVHGSREGAAMKGTFHAWRIEYDPRTRAWTDEELDTSNAGDSRVIITLGSGNDALNREIEVWNASPQQGTARALFSAFCDALEAGLDPLTGGVPQLVSLDRRSAGKAVGYIGAETRYVHGLPINYSPAQDGMEWVDSLFNRMSPETLERLSGAQRQVRVEKPADGGLLRFLQRIAKSGQSPE